MNVIRRDSDGYMVHRESGMTGSGPSSWGRTLDVALGRHYEGDTRGIQRDEQARAAREYAEANDRVHVSRASIAREGKRGDMVELGEARGRYIGTSKSGCQWVAWEGENYLSLCNTFDTQVARERNAPRARFVSRTEQDRAARLYREACASEVRGAQ